MQEKSTDEMMVVDEVNLYDYWKVLVQRKRLFLCIFLIPLVLVIIISLILPRYYRGESEISNLIIPASNIVNLVGNVDDAKKVKIFAGNSGAIKSVLVSLPKKSPDKVSIVIDAKTEDIATQAFKDIFNYISNLPEVKAEVARIHEETDLKLKKIIEETDLKLKTLIEAKKANLIFLKDMSDMIKKRKLTIVNFNPADLVRKDGDLSLEIMNLQKAKSDAMKKRQLLFVDVNSSALIKRNADLPVEIMNLLNVKVTAGILSPPAITKQPANAQIKQIIIMALIISLMAVMFVVFFINYIERMNARKNA